MCDHHLICGLLTGDQFVNLICGNACSVYHFKMILLLNMRCHYNNHDFYQKMLLLFSFIFHVLMQTKKKRAATQSCYAKLLKYQVKSAHLVTMIVTDSSQRCIFQCITAFKLTSSTVPSILFRSR